MALYLDETIVVPRLRVIGASASALRQREIVFVECPEQPDRGPTATLQGGSGPDIAAPAPAAAR
jgi:hypothetical protein